MATEWMNKVLVLILKFISLMQLEILIRNLSFPDPDEHLKISSTKPNLFIIKIISNISPPLWVLRFLDKLL